MMIAKKVKKLKIKLRLQLKVENKFKRKSVKGERTRRRKKREANKLLLLHKVNRQKPCKMKEAFLIKSCQLAIQMLKN